MSSTPSDGWSTVPISQLYEGLYDGPHATPKPADDGPIFLGIKNVTEDGHLDLTDIRHIAEEEFATWTRRIEPRPGDIVFTYEATLNRYAIIPDGFRGCLGRRMALIRPNPRRVDTRYLHFYFFTPAWREIIRQFTLAGATVDRLPLTRFPEFPVRAPPIMEQRRIARILAAYDDLIENCERRIRVLDEMARTLYREWFVNFRYLGHEKVPLVDSPLGRIPKGWNVTTLGQLIQTHIGGGWGAETRDERHSEAGWVLRGTDIPDARRANIASVPFRYHTLSNIRSRQLEPFDIVFETSGGSKGQPVGRALLVTPALLDAFDGAVICASFCKRITPTTQLYDPHLFYLSLDAAYESGEIDTYQVQSTGITNFKWSEYLSGVSRPVPPSNVQRSFRAIVEPLFGTISLLGIKATNLRKTRDLLLPRLLSGQLSVDVEFAA